MKQDNTSTSEETTQEISTLDLFRIEIKESRYNGVTNEAIRDARRLFKLDDEQLCRFGRCLISDLGRLAKEQVKGVKLGNKLNKDNEITVREVADSIKLPITPAIRLLKLCHILNTVATWGMEVNKSSLVLKDDVTSWLENRRD